MALYSDNLTELVLDNQRLIIELEKNTDTFFVLFSSIIISFMQCGFAFLEAGSVRSKNTTNILLKNLLDTFIGCFVYWAIGYAIAFGDGNFMFGHSGWFGTFPEEERITWFFQFVFAATACTIVSGSVAERCDIWPYFIYSCVITGIVYPAVSRWAWSSDGWLAQEGLFLEGVKFSDFAGSGVVHLTGAVVALWGAVFCGPRIGRFDAGGLNNLPGHSVPLAALGAFILLFGFFAFNGSSQRSVSQPGDGVAIATSIFNTVVSGTGGAMATLLLTKIIGKIQEYKYKDLVRSRWSILKTINGTLVGMVAICAGCNRMPSWAAFVTGVVASFFYMITSVVLVQLKIDDPLEAVAVHGGGGLWGLIAAPIFTELFNYRTMAKQLAVNLIGTVTIICWTSLWGIAIFGSLYKLKILRVSAAMEKTGMDKEKHGEPAYPDAVSEGDGKERTMEMKMDVKSFSGLINSIFCHSIGGSRNSLDEELSHRRRSLAIVVDEELASDTVTVSIPRDQNGGNEPQPTTEIE